MTTRKKKNLLLLFGILAAGGAKSQQQVGLPDDDVMRIHVVEKRPFTEAGRWELSLFGMTQVNPKFTVHAGFSAELAYHLRENLAVQLGGSFFPIAQQSSLSEELLNKSSEAPATAEAFLMRGDVVAGLELMPVYGKLNVFDGKILRLGMYLNAGLGVAKTRLQLRPPTRTTDPKTNEVKTTDRTFGDTGIRPIASLGAGLRVFVTEQFTVRLELRDYAYSGYVSTVNGCNRADAETISKAFNTNQTPSNLSSGCDYSAFGPGGPSNAGTLNVGGALELLRNPSAEVINNIAFQGGVSWLF
jgi:outer membrane beta-barrel protein